MTASRHSLTADRLRALGANPLDYEIAQEKASALSRAGEKLAQALSAYRACEDETQRAELLAGAAERLWFFIVQREACGLRDHRLVYELYEVPAAVRAAMGPRKSAES